MEKCKLQNMSVHLLSYTPKVDTARLAVGLELDLDEVEIANSHIDKLKDKKTASPCHRNQPLGRATGSYADRP